MKIDSPGKMYGAIVAGILAVGLIWTVLFDSGRLQGLTFLGILGLVFLSGIVMVPVLLVRSFSASNTSPDKYAIRFGYIILLALVATPILWYGCIELLAPHTPPSVDEIQSDNERTDRQTHNALKNSFQLKPAEDSFSNENEI